VSQLSNKAIIAAIAAISTIGENRFGKPLESLTRNAR
jgi:hypothetical protein